MPLESDKCSFIANCDKTLVIAQVGHRKRALDCEISREAAVHSRALSSRRGLVAKGARSKEQGEKAVAEGDSKKSEGALVNNS